MASIKQLDIAFKAAAADANITRAELTTLTRKAIQLMQTSEGLPSAIDARFTTLFEKYRPLVEASARKLPTSPHARAKEIQRLRTASAVLTLQEIARTAGTLGTGKNTVDTSSICLEKEARTSRPFIAFRLADGGIGLEGSKAARMLAETLVRQGLTYEVDIGLRDPGCVV